MYHVFENKAVFPFMSSLTVNKYEFQNINNWFKIHKRVA